MSTAMTKRQHLNTLSKNRFSQQKMIKTTFKHDEILETRNLKKNKYYKINRINKDHMIDDL